MNSYESQVLQNLFFDEYARQILILAVYTYRKYVVLALTSMKFFQFLVFHEVLIY